MITADLLDSAKQGNPQALSHLLNQSLQRFGISAQAYRDYDHGLTIQLEATAGSEILQPERILPWLQQGIERLGWNGSIPRIRVLAHCAEQSEVLWIKYLQFDNAASAEPEPASGDHLPLPYQRDRFLVCGLGRLGQHCVVALKAFQVNVVAIDLTYPSVWQIEAVPSLLDEDPILGDCRSESVLLQAQIHRCRAALLVTQDESINLEAAITIHKINPHVRLVVRSSKQNLNRLLERRLTNFVAYDPTELPATAFSLAALGEDTIGAFSVDDLPLQVVRRQVQPGEIFDRFSSYRFHRRALRLLHYQKQGGGPPISGEPFFSWNPNTLIQAGDVITYIERVESRPVASVPQTNFWEQLQQRLASISLLSRLRNFNLGETSNRLLNWIQENQLRRNIILAATLALVMGINTSAILRSEVGVSWPKAIQTSLVLLLGGFGDVFGGLDQELPVAPWVMGLSFLTTLISAIFVLGVFGLVADAMLSARFEFLQNRPPIPEQNHVVVFGLGRVGRKVAAFLMQRQQPVVAITQNPEQEALLPMLPVVVGNFLEGLTQVSLVRAKSVVMVTDDQLLNLELGLTAHDLVHQALLNREGVRQFPLGIVIRTYDQTFSANLANLLPEAKAFSAYALSAEAFAGAAFGENILGLFRLQDHTVLVTEYHIEANDTLNGRLLSHVAYGYGVVPIFYQSAKHAHTQMREVSDFLMPSDTERLGIGDRLIVLATINGLRRIERGELSPPQPWQLTVLKPKNNSVLFEASRILHNVSGCGLRTARDFLEHLPGKMQLQLYNFQAYDLWQRLGDMKQLPIRLERINSSAIESLPTLGSGEESLETEAGSTSRS
jgi:Trk K+ transport system NAD-binding subunit